MRTEISWSFVTADPERQLSSFISSSAVPPPTHPLKKPHFHTLVLYSVTVSVSLGLTCSFVRWLDVTDGLMKGCGRTRPGLCNDCCYFIVLLCVCVHVQVCVHQQLSYTDGHVLTRGKNLKLHINKCVKRVWNVSVAAAAAVLLKSINDLWHTEFM